MNVKLCMQKENSAGGTWVMNTKLGMLWYAVIAYNSPTQVAQYCVICLTIKVGSTRQTVVIPLSTSYPRIISWKLDKMRLQSCLALLPVAVAAAPNACADKQFCRINSGVINSLKQDSAAPAFCVSYLGLKTVTVWVGSHPFKITWSNNQAAQLLPRLRQRQATIQNIWPSLRMRSQA